VLTVASTDFDTKLTLRGPDLLEVATNDNQDSTTTNSRIKVLLPAGTYTLYVSSSKVGASGAYTVTSETGSPQAEHCEEAFIVRGVTVPGFITGQECELTPNTYSNRYRIFLNAGTQIQVEVKDLSYYEGPNAEIIAPDGSNATGTGGGNLNQVLNYVAPVGGYYTLLLGLIPNGEIGYQYSAVIR
jgi:hypothetical protein